jgi:hypothetical protein
MLVTQLLLVKLLGLEHGQNSNFIGNQADLHPGAQNSNFLGQNAGSGATSAQIQISWVQGAGQGATNATYSNYIGQNAGNGATGANDSKFHGFCKLVKEATSYLSNFFFSRVLVVKQQMLTNQISLVGMLVEQQANQSTFIGSVLVKVRQLHLIQISWVL